MRAELTQSSANAFQIALPGSASHTTEWLRGAIGPSRPIARTPAEPLAAWTDRPSIAVLPFDDLSEGGVAADPYLGDFVTEEVTASLARMGGLFVCFRHSASAYRG